MQRPLDFEQTRKKEKDHEGVEPGFLEGMVKTLHWEEADTRDREETTALHEPHNHDSLVGALEPGP